MVDDAADDDAHDERDDAIERMHDTNPAREIAPLLKTTDWVITVITSNGLVGSIVVSAHNITQALRQAYMARLTQWLRGKTPPEDRDD